MRADALTDLMADSALVCYTLAYIWLCVDVLTEGTLSWNSHFPSH
jgi:hypothetical protein